MLEVVNLRSMFDIHGPAEGSLEEPLTTLAYDYSAEHGGNGTAVAATASAVQAHRASLAASHA